MTQPLEIPCISFQLPGDPMRGEDWVAFTTIVIPVQQHHTIDHGCSVNIYPTQSVSVTGKSRSEALERLSVYVGDLLSGYPEVASSTLYVTPKSVPRHGLIRTSQKKVVG